MVKLISLLLFAFFTGSVVAQVAPASTAASPQPKAAAAAANTKMQNKGTAEVAADAPVITIPGFCETPATNGKNCETVITRADFEALANAVSGGRPDAATSTTRQHLAKQYGETLAFAREADKRGLSKDADLALLLRFARTQVLAQYLLRSLEKQTHSSTEEIQKYYDENKANYAGIAVQRLIIPTRGEKGKPLNADPKLLAREMQERLGGAEHAANLQQEIAEKLSLTNPPDTALIVPARQLSPDDVIVKLKPGEVSEVITDPNVLVIYKSEGPKPVPLEQVKGEIETALRQQKLKATADAILNEHKPALNTAYFGPIREKKAHHGE